LGDDPRIELICAVPSELPGMLAARRVDVALIPVVDLVRAAEPLSVLSDACIAAEGETMTVRVFSHVPPDRIDTLYVDGDSHTSVALARVIWSRLHRRTLRIVPLPDRDDLADCQAVLLIGDKVVSADVCGFGYDVDLGGAWKTLTGLPFVFAVWATPEPDRFGWLAEALSEARDRGLASARRIAERDGPGLGWPVPAAVEYLTSKLSFTLTPKFQHGMDLFLQSISEDAIVEPGGTFASGAS